MEIGAEGGESCEEETHTHTHITFYAVSLAFSRAVKLSSIPTPRSPAGHVLAAWELK